MGGCAGCGLALQSILRYTRFPGSRPHRGRSFLAGPSWDRTVPATCMATFEVGSRVQKRVGKGVGVCGLVETVDGDKVVVRREDDGTRFSKQSAANFTRCGEPAAARPAPVAQRTALREGDSVAKRGARAVSWWWWKAKKWW